MPGVASLQVANAQLRTEPGPRAICGGDRLFDSDDRALFASRDAHEDVLTWARAAKVDFSRETMFAMPQSEVLKAFFGNSRFIFADRIGMVVDLTDGWRAERCIDQQWTPSASLWLTEVVIKEELTCA